VSIKKIFVAAVDINKKKAAKGKKYFGDSKIISLI
jgi:hypothetical protein